MYGMVTTITVCYIWTSALRQGYPQPTAIYVSPLQRTLQTAAILFPEHPGFMSLGQCHCEAVHWGNRNR